MKILQIIPAHGVVAKFEDGSTCPIVCWQLYEEFDDEGPLQFVSGLVILAGYSELADVSETDGFVEYLYA